MTTEHRLSDAFFRGFTKRILRFAVPLMLFSVVGGWYASKGGIDRATGVGLVVVVAAIAFSAARTVRQQKRSFRSLCIRVEADRLVRLQADYPPVEIAYADIKKVVEHASFGLTVQGLDPRQTIFLFSTLERFEELRARLAAHHPIEPHVPTFWSFPKLLGMILVPLVAVIIVSRSTSPRSVWPAGCAALIILALCALTVARSPHLERRTKRGLWWLIPVFFSIGLKMWFVVWGWK